MKTCPRCERALALSAFGTRSRGGPRSNCRQCEGAEFQRYDHKRFGDDRTARARYQRNFKLKSMYGITVEDYERMEAQQGGLCVVCRNPPTGGKSLSVDHNHATGEVRGLLCGRCNFAAGNMRDDPELVDRLAAYLRRESVEM